MNEAFRDHLTSELEAIRDAGLFKGERVIVGPQNAAVTVDTGQEVLNFCANNYLGLANHPSLRDAAERALGNRGFGMASVRFICGTQDVHKELEHRIGRFLEKDDTILYSSCWDANGGLFETILGPDDAVISDALNHASIIDGIRLCKAKRFRYASGDISDLRKKLDEAKDARFKLIATDGVFSMDGVLADLPSICDAADEHDALVMVDDSHAVGFVGEKGKGTAEHQGVLSRVDILTGTLGKALGGASGGYTAGPQEVIDLLRQRSRPYLFSNSLAPTIASASIAALDLLEASDDLRQKLRRNAERFRSGMTALGFKLIGADHPIIPVMLGDARLAAEMAEALLTEGVYVIGFSYPVVPKGQARIRTQMSASHEDEHIDRAIEAFAKVGRAMGVIG